MFRYESYAVAGGREGMLLHGPLDGPRVLILPPLFGEMNGTRALLVDLARRLAAAGFAVALPDLPGTGESARALETIGWADWRDAARAASEHLRDAQGIAPWVLSIRGGALLDDGCAGRGWWRFAPAAGAGLIRQLERAQLVADREGNRAERMGADALELAGYRIAPDLAEAIRAADMAAPPGRVRTLAFDGPGLAPWRRAEPAGDPQLAGRLAEDALSWIRACAA